MPEDTKFQQYMENVIDSKKMCYAGRNLEDYEVYLRDFSTLIVSKYKYYDSVTLRNDLADFQGEEHVILEDPTFEEKLMLAVSEFAAINMLDVILCGRKLLQENGEEKALAQCEQNLDNLSLELEKVQNVSRRLSASYDASQQQVMESLYGAFPTLEEASFLANPEVASRKQRELQDQKALFNGVKGYLDGSIYKKCMEMMKNQYKMIEKNQKEISGGSNMPNNSSSSIIMPGQIGIPDSSLNSSDFPQEQPLMQDADQGLDTNYQQMVQDVVGGGDSVSEISSGSQNSFGEAEALLHVPPVSVVPVEEKLQPLTDSFSRQPIGIASLAGQTTMNLPSDVERVSSADGDKTLSM